MEELKEYRLFRNQLIVATILFLVVGVETNTHELTGFGVVFGLIALYNIYTYKQNVKDYNKLKSKK